MISLLFLVLFSSSCRDGHKPLGTSVETAPPFSYSTIEEIPLPPGFQRMAVQNGSFCQWLRTIKLKKNGTVYLYNGKPKEWQGAQFAVLDMPVGDKDLQQCADAVMRLRAEYFFQKEMYDSISFHASNGIGMSFEKWMKGERYKTSGNKLVAYQTIDKGTDRRKEFETYLEAVFTYCGTYSLADDLKRSKTLSAMLPGDVFVKPGSPGHAMIVVDLAGNDKGEKIFMLAQSYMPAQDIHIVKNPRDNALSPWYRVTDATEIVTPEWIFHSNQLKAW
jgi:hypothetical protein